GVPVVGAVVRRHPRIWHPRDSKEDQTWRKETAGLRPTRPGRHPRKCAGNRTEPESRRGLLAFRTGAPAARLPCVRAHDLNPDHNRPRSDFQARPDTRQVDNRHRSPEVRARARLPLHAAVRRFVALRLLRSLLWRLYGAVERTRRAAI